jgi:FkbM family methyltransferase
LPIWDLDGNYITGISSDMDNFKILMNEDGYYELYFMFNNIFNPNTLLNVVAIFDKSEALYRNKSELLEVYNPKPRNFGFIQIPHEWNLSIYKKVFDFKNVILNVDSSDKDGLSYNSKKSYEELNNKIYTEIKQKFNPDIVIDIGANYGFISLVLSKVFQKPKIIMVEASNKLIKYIEKNMQVNNVENYVLHNAICAEVNDKNRNFAQNPWGSQDNRVIGENEKWETNKVKTISLDHIFSKNRAKFYFIKIDTQGYEQNVFKGGEEFLVNNNNWIIKTEFAPYWINSQGFSPYDFLEYLLDRYIVTEAPVRTNFKGSCLNSLFKNQIQKTDIKEFIEYTINHNRNNKGWCDLYIFPKDLKELINE